MMLGLVNIVRGCCHAATSSSRGVGAIGGVVALLVVLALFARGVGPVAAAVVDPLSAVNVALSTLLEVLIGIAGVVAALVALGWLAWWLRDRARSAGAARTYAAHLAALDAAAAERRHAEQVATEHQPRQPAASDATDPLEGTEPAASDAPTAPVDEPAPVELDDLDELAARRNRRWSA